MKPARFDYCRPETVADALGSWPSSARSARVLAGGMTLGPMLNLRMVRPRAVIDISRIAALDGIELRGDRPRHRRRRGAGGRARSP